MRVRELRSGICGWLGVLLLLAGATPVLADSRDFVFTYDTTLLPPGDVEYEQWLTLQSEKENDRAYDRLDVRHEFEFGVTERFQLALYLDWRSQDGASVDDGTEVRDVAVEGGSTNSAIPCSISSAARSTAR